PWRVALGYLQPFPPSNSPQTYYLLYFTTSLQKIPPPITPSLQPFPPYLFPLSTITHYLTIYLTFLNLKKSYHNCTVIIQIIIVLRGSNEINIVKKRCD